MSKAHASRISFKEFCIRKSTLRKSIAELEQLQIEAESYNDNWNTGEPVTLEGIDKDIAELKAELKQLDRAHVRVVGGNGLGQSE